MKSDYGKGRHDAFKTMLGIINTKKNIDIYELKCIIEGGIMLDNLFENKGKINKIVHENE